MEATDRVLHGFRLLRSYELYNLPPVFPSWTHFLRVTKGLKRVALMTQLLVDGSYSGVMTVPTWSVRSGQEEKRTMVCPGGGRARMLEMVQELKDHRAHGEWSWGSRGSTLLSLDAIMMWLLMRTWYEPVRVVKLRPPTRPDPDAWVSEDIAPHARGWKPTPLPADDPARYANYVNRINAAPVEELGYAVTYAYDDEDMDDMETVSLASTVGGDDGWPESPL